MKIKKIIDNCRRSGRVLLTESPYCQWLGDGSALYPLYGLPRFDENTLYETYDISEKQAEKIVYTHVDSSPQNLSFSDAIEKEIPVGKPILTFVSGGRIVRGYETSGGIAFVDVKYFAPFSDTNGSDLRLYERYDTAGRLYFAVKLGLLLIALIMPIDIIDETLIQQLDKLLTLCRLEHSNRSSLHPNQTWADDELRGFDNDEGKE